MHFFKIFLSKTIPIILIFFSFSLYGKKFKASYVKFDIEYDWVCKSFGVVEWWVCHHYLHKGAKPSLMLITAKEGNTSDNLNLYIQTSNEEQTINSKKIHVKKILVNHQVWVESFYRNSVLKNVFSRYVATVCCDEMQSKIHILIGFHAHKENYTKYSSEFLKSIKSLRLSKNLKEVLAQIGKPTDKQKQDMLSYIERILFNSDLERDIPIQKNQKSPAVWVSLFIGFILVLSAILLYLFYYKKIGKRKTRIRRKK